MIQPTLTELYPLPISGGEPDLTYKEGKETPALMDTGVPQQRLLASPINVKVPVKGIKPEVSIGAKPPENATNSPKLQLDFFAPAIVIAISFPFLLNVITIQVVRQSLEYSPWHLQ